MNCESLAIITGVASEVNKSKDPFDYSIGCIKESRLFDRIVLASPRDNHANMMRELADNWSVDFYAGAIDNVLERFAEVIKRYKPVIVSRIQLRAMWVDVKLIEVAIEKVKNGYDYVDFHYDINYAFGSDTFSASAFFKVYDLICKMEDAEQKLVYEFSPWALMQEANLLNVGIIKTIQPYSQYKIKQIKTRLENLIGTEQNQIPVTTSNPGSRYRNLVKYLHRDDIVLDIACGYGGGTAFLSSYCKKIYGIDSDIRYINYAKHNYEDENINYLHGSDSNIQQLGEMFDVITSLHTLEHVENDRAFLASIFNYLKHNGTLLIEVPRLMKYPIGEPLWPFHVVEYSVEGLRKLLLQTGFIIIEERGGNRNKYVKIEKAREVIFMVARKE